MSDAILTPVDKLIVGEVYEITDPIIGRVDPSFAEIQAITDEGVRARDLHTQQTRLFSFECDFYTLEQRDDDPVDEESALQGPFECFICHPEQVHPNTDLLLRDTHGGLFLDEADASQALSERFKQRQPAYVLFYELPMEKIDQAEPAILAINEEIAALRQQPTYSDSKSAFQRLFDQRKALRLAHCDRLYQAKQITYWAMICGDPTQILIPKRDQE